MIALVLVRKCGSADFKLTARKQGARSLRVAHLTGHGDAIRHRDLTRYAES